MNNEISGIKISEEIIELYKDVSREEGSKLAIKISTEIAKEIYNYVDGYYLITPFKRIDIISEIINNISDSNHNNLVSIPVALDWILGKQPSK